MSRIGKKHVSIPSGVSVELSGSALSVKGPKGHLAMTLVDEVIATQEDGGIVVRPRTNNQRGRAMWGLQRTLVSNLVTGVSTGFTVKLAITGVGYRAAVQGKTLTLQLGYSHDVVYPIPDGIEIKTATPTEIEISGIDKQKIGQIAAEIREWRKPEPYKGKGVRYVGEFIFRKEGKKK
jgi:large subunit ribosomal protein L6